MLRSTIVLVVVDMQAGLDDPQYGVRNNPACEERIAALLIAWRSMAQPVVYTRHISSRNGSPLAAGSSQSAIKSSLQPGEGESVFEKSTNSAFKTPAFAKALEGLRPCEVVFAVMATDACVTACAREAKDLGYSVTVVADACATFERKSSAEAAYPADTVHGVSLAALAASGIVVKTTPEVLASLNANA